ncbi:MAG: glycosyltransferase family 39 protein [Candidatus Omnitrophica bacterium]|nr:glycosyltransferase family 39 protein [Candidatus Omnitrophota bacterium]
MKRNKELLIKILFFSFLVLAPRLFFFFITENFYNEEPPFYIYDALQIIKSGEIPLQHNHPGGYQLILAAIISLSKFISDKISPILLPRLITLLLGIFSAGIYYLLIKYLFKKSNALISFIILCLHYPFIILSVNTLNYMPMYFFVLLGILTFIYFLDKNDVKYYICSAISIAFAAMMRQAAWPLPFILTLILISKRRILQSVLFFLLTFAYPIYYMVRLYHDNAPFAFYYVGGGLDDKCVNTLNTNLIFAFPEYLINNYPSYLFIAGLAGIVISLFRYAKGYNHKIILAIFFLTNFMIYNFLVMTNNFIFISEYGSLHPRYSVLFILLLLPFSIEILEKISANIFRFKKNVAMLVVAILMIPSMVLSWQGVSSDLKQYMVPEAYNDLSDYLKKNISKQSKLIIASNRRQYIVHALIKSNRTYDVINFFDPPSFGHEYILDELTAEGLCNSAEDVIKEYKLDNDTDYAIIFDSSLTRLKQVDISHLESRYPNKEYKIVRFGDILLIRP